MAGSMAALPRAITLSSDNNFSQGITFTARAFPDNTGRLRLYIQGIVIANEIIRTSGGLVSVTHTFDAESLKQYFNGANTNTLSIQAKLFDADGDEYATTNVDVTLNAPPILTSHSVKSSWTSDDNIFINGITTATANATFEGQFGASIQSAVCYLSAEEGSESDIIYLNNVNDIWTGTSGYINIHTKANYEFWAIDSRGEEYIASTPQGSIVIKEHAVPTVSVDAFRCDANGDKDMDGGYVSIRTWANSNPVELGLIRLVLRLEDEVGNIIDSVGNVTSGTRYVLGYGQVDPDTRYTLEAVAEDAYGLESNAVELLYPVKRIINVKDGGTGIAFGKKATEDNRVDSAWAIYSDEAIHAYLTQYCDYGDGTNITRKPAIALTTNSATQGGINTFSRAGVLQWSPSSVDGNLTDIYEAYRFPTVDSDLASNKTYDLLSTKTIGLSQVFNDTGMTASVVRNYTITDSARGVLIINGANQTGRGLYIFSATSAGAVTYTAVASSSLVTVTTGTNSITLTKSSSNTSMFPTFIMTNGTVTLT